MSNLEMTSPNRHYPVQFAQASPASAAPMTGVVLGALGLRAGFVFIRKVVWAVAAPAPGAVVTGDEVSTMEVTRVALDGVEALVGLGAAVLFFVWFYKLYKGLRARGAATRFSPGMAIGGWFIPFANVVLPFLTVRDAWRHRVVGDRNWGLVLAWWLTYVAFTGVSSIDRVMSNPDLYAAMPPVGLQRLIGALYMPLELGAFGLWMAVVWLLGRPQK